MDFSEKKQLSLQACKVRQHIIEGTFNAKSGHPGGSLSAADIITYLYFKEMRVDPKNPKWEDRDRFVLSKGHAAPALYGALAVKGFFPEDEIKNLRKPASFLQGHPDMKGVPGVDMSTGSLGQGVSCAVGMALAGKVTGKDYRKDQLRGYQLYQKYIDSIITDTTVFINRHLLETFIERNIPSLAKYKNSMETVDPKTFESELGVTGQQAIDHYTNWMRVRYNRRKIRNKDKMFHKYVKAPIRTEGLRLDTIITNPDGGMTYAYIQTINTRPKLKRADVTLAGEIFEGPEKVYSIPQTDPITFYISSLSSFTDGRNKYRSMIVYRQVEANSACWVDFEQGRSEVKLDLSNNATEIARIKKNLRGLLDNETFEMDSINVLASCSPEGSIITNAKLAQARAESVTGYFKDYMRHVADSMRREAGFAVSVDDSYKTSEMSSAYKAADITFQSTSRAENWDPLDKLVEKDETLTDADKQDYKEMRSSIGDVDALERQMQGRPWYKYVRETLYPRLRTVEFTFHMHRRGMVKDTVHSTVLDTAYMAGVEALKDRDYELAITKLRPYSPDYNLAVAYCAMDYNVSAQDILEQLPETAEVDYMLALVYARKGNGTAAVKRYMSSIQKNPSYKFRGNLDPEISELIKRYRLDKVGAEDDIPVDL